MEQCGKRHKASKFSRQHARIGARIFCVNRLVFRSFEVAVVVLAVIGPISKVSPGPGGVASEGRVRARRSPEAPCWAIVKENEQYILNLIFNSH